MKTQYKIGDEVLLKRGDATVSATILKTSEINPLYLEIRIWDGIRHVGDTVVTPYEILKKTTKEG